MKAHRSNSLKQIAISLLLFTGARPLSNATMLHSFIASLDDLSILKIAGEQRFEYLHGQITIATKNAPIGSARLAAHCDFKGKMFSAMVVSQTNDAFLLSMHKDAARESEAQLKKYGVFSKVEIAMCNDLQAVGVTGEKNINLLKKLFPSLSETPMSTQENEFGQTICFNDTSLRYLSYLTDKGTQQLRDISGNEDFIACDSWNMLEIEAGIANIQQATIGQFIPQMLNFQCINAIDFDKGCYMGQEVVARTKFLGKNKRASFLLSAEESNNIAVNAGDDLEVQIGDSWRRGGVVVRSAKQQSDQGISLKLLAVMPNDTELGTKVRLKACGTALNLMPMPYNLQA